MPKIVELTQGLEKYRTDILLLLVGGNPLPNAVAGALLAREESTVVLVHSRSTCPLAQRLAKLLSGEDGPTCVLVEVKEANPGDIYGSVHGTLESRWNNSVAGVGLNYTGGTKAMAVHAYAAVADWARQNQVTPVLSYLDASTLSLRFAPSPSAPSGPCDEIRVGTSIRVALTEMLELHGWKLDSRDPPNPTPRWPKAAEELAKILAGEQGWSEYRQWLQKLFRTAGEQDDKTSLHLPDKVALAPFASAWRKDLGLAQAARTLDLGTKEEYRETTRWLEGIWLEQHVLGILQNLSDSFGLHECFQHVAVLDPGTGIHFDLDVVAVRGYQLFVFSCGVSEKRQRLKSKLLEVAIRARQVGGDEARVALVCGSDEPEDLEKEVRQQLGSDAVRVFGKHHLRDLENEVGAWIERAVA